MIHFNRSDKNVVSVADGKVHIELSNKLDREKSVQLLEIVSELIEECWESDTKFTLSCDKDRLKIKMISGKPVSKLEWRLGYDR